MLNGDPGPWINRQLNVFGWLVVIEAQLYPRLVITISAHRDTGSLLHFTFQAALRVLTGIELLQVEADIICHIAL